jgi:hypothetical protein
MCADAQGFSMHAIVRCAAHDRKALERLCRLTLDELRPGSKQTPSRWRAGRSHFVGQSPL